jgi:hypothetical protein
MATALREPELLALGRSQYHSSGIVDWAALIPHMVLGVLGAAAVAGAMAFCRVMGFYFIVMTAIIGGALTMLICRWVIRRGRCRNAAVAIMYAIPLGLFTYLGYYQARLVEVGGWDMLRRIELLPQYIWFCWEREAFGKGGRPIGPGGDFQFYCNAVVFFVELFLLVGATVVGAQGAATKVYSEQSECWSKSISRVVPEWVAPAIVEAVQTGDLAELLPSIEVLPIPNPKKPPPRSILELEYVVDGETSVGYLNVSHVTRGVRLLIRQLLLTREELRSSLPLFFPDATIQIPEHEASADPADAVEPS